jgi:hypothetical protein
MDVKSTFSNTYKLYKENLENPLFWNIMSNIGNVPPAIARGIMADTYNFYLKWEELGEFKTGEEVNWSQMLGEAKELNRKYNDCDCIRNIMLFIVDMIEQDFRPGGSDE